MNFDDHQLEEFDKTEEAEPGYFQKWFFGFIDGVVVIGLFFLLNRYLPYGSLYVAIRAVNATVFAMILLILYRVMTISFFGATPGMLLLKIKFLNGEENPPTMMEKLLASIFIYINGLKYYDKR